MKSDLLSRRLLLKRTALLGLLAAVERLVPAYASTNTLVNPGAQTALSGDVIDLTISEELFRLDGRTAKHLVPAVPAPSGLSRRCAPCFRCGNL